MKAIGKRFIFIFAFLALTASAYAQSSREELQQMVEQLQKSPADTALRKQIITLAQELKPARQFRSKPASRSSWDRRY